MKKPTRTAYWIFNDNFILPTFLSVASFLRWCKVPVILVFYGKRINDVKRYFASLISDKLVTIEQITEDFFTLPIPSFNSDYQEIIRNRELRFYVAARSSSEDVVYYFDSDTVFTESAKYLLDINFVGCQTVCGCVELEHTYCNKLYFERGVKHTNRQHIYPEDKKKFNQIFNEETFYWLEKPQYNNGVLIFFNARELAKRWREEHVKGLTYPDVNPGEDQVTLTAAIYKEEKIVTISLPPCYNSMGQIDGDYAVFHATAGQWKGEIINSISENQFIQDHLSDCAREYKKIIDQYHGDEILEELPSSESIPFLYHSIKGFFFFESAYSYLYEILPRNSTFVEIGTHKGKSICYFAELEKEWKKGIRIYSIDNYSNIGFSGIIEFKNTLENISLLGMSDYVNLINKDSIHAANIFSDESIDCVFIDGDHRYESVLSDLECWYKKVRSGGILAGDDYTRCQSVRKAVDDFCKRRCITFTIWKQCFFITK